MIHLVVVVFVLCSCTCKGYPSKCKDDSYFDPMSQKYLPCSECNEKIQKLCYHCCPQKDTDAIYLSKPQTTESVPSIKYEDTAKQNIVGLIFHILIISMVVCTLSVIVCVGIKVAKDRRTNSECSSEDSRHSHCHDVSVVEEVWVMPPQSSMEKSPQSVNVVVSQLQENTSKQGALEKPML
ncbi:uncharacterized protein LOC110238059 [Exaiptasia diaphana]|uniref:Uncharacterized protein n=1 Tax=Exaiptasia diaphana TaxID=2652724 RepID=A0A913X5Q4_EXADI|nr:uncharacterized protein LOC110238059 [Exaiptasia diaphana]KXJ28551.1 hypothetical protein AC249_AIPGENE17333 [Exaiptasia diaphana]